MEVVRFLAEDCGPRTAAGPREERVLDFLERRLTDSGLAVRREPFVFRSWEATGDWILSLSHNGSETHEMPAVPLPYTNLESVGLLNGSIEWEGDWPLIAGRLNCPRFVIRDAHREIVAAVIGYPGGHARPLPNPNPILALPTVVIGGDDAAQLRGTLDQGSSGHASITGGRSSEGLRRSVNLVAQRPGDHPWLTIVAHYDSVQDSPGANDNASGVALLIRLAERAAAQADGRARFVLVGAEEPFIAGSRAYVAAAGTSSELGYCRAALNLDMVAVGDQFSVRCIDNSLWRRAAQRLPSHTGAGTPITTTDLYGSSDHWAFHEVGIPSAQLTREPDVEWHTPGDSIDRIPSTALDEAESVATALINEIDGEVSDGDKRA